MIAGDLHLDLHTRRASIGARAVHLSRIEFQVLAELARVPGRVLSYEHLLMVAGQVASLLHQPALRYLSRVMMCLEGASLLADRKIELQLTPAARDWLADVGYDPVYGARPLKRTIQRYLQDPLALQILGGEFKEGDVVEVDADQEKLYFKRAGIIVGE